jgi:hypothetical protein
MSIDWATVIASIVSAFSGGLASYLFSMAHARGTRGKTMVQELASEWDADRLLSARVKVELALREYMDNGPHLPSADDFYAFCRDRGDHVHFSTLVHFIKKTCLMWSNRMLHRTQAKLFLGDHMMYWQERLGKIPAPSGSEWERAFQSIKLARWFSY